MAINRFGYVDVWTFGRLENLTQVEEVNHLVRWCAGTGHGDFYP